MQPTPDPFEMLRVAHDLGEIAHRRLLELFRKDVGALLDQLLADPALIWAHLDDSNPRIREAAIWVAICHWRMLPEFQQKCISMSTNDPDEGVKRFTVGLLREYDQGTGPSVGKHLALIVQDGKSAIAMREAAYKSLVVYSGNYRNVLYGGKIVVDIRFPDDVDWDLVNRFASART